MISVQLFSIFNSCCPDVVYIHYGINNIELKLMNKETLEILNDSAIINYQQYSIDYKLFTEEYAQELNQNTLSIYNNLYATSCPPSPQYRIQNRIIGIEITCDKDFDSEHPKGSDISELFSPYGISGICLESGGNFTNCAEYRLKYGGSFVSILNEAISLEAHWENVDSINNNDHREILVLDKKPEQSDYMRFTITLEFEDGKKISDGTNVVQLIMN